MTAARPVSGSVLDFSAAEESCFGTIWCVVSFLKPLVNNTNLTNAAKVLVMHCMVNKCCCLGHNWSRKEMKVTEYPVRSPRSVGESVGSSNGDVTTRLESVSVSLTHCQCQSVTVSDIVTIRTVTLWLSGAVPLSGSTFQCTFQCSAQVFKRKGQGAIWKGHFSAVNGPSKGHFSAVNGPSKGHFSAVNWRKRA